jgi:spore coat assembly protein
LDSEPKLDRGDDYFYVPGRVLHIDADNDYLNRCLNYYKQNNIQANGMNVSEIDLPFKIRDLLEEHNPDIIVITGHDAYYRRKGNIDDISAYKNSINFLKAIKEARKYEKSHEKLIIIAGACQSDYEELIKAGANFASSPKRINIHALDPAIIATRIRFLRIINPLSLFINKKIPPTAISPYIVTEYFLLYSFSFFYYNAPVIEHLTG